MRETLPNRSSLTAFGLFVLLVLFILGIVFNKLASPGTILFSNDAPLGAVTAYSSVAMTFFSGAWHHLNWLGNIAPSALPNVTYGLYLLWGPVVYSKLFFPISMLLLAVGAWVLCRALGFNFGTAAVVGLAAMLNGDPFSYGAWGLPSQVLNMASAFVALGLVAGATPEKRFNWIRYALAGAAVGMGLMEGYDVGAIFSLYVAAFTFFLAVRGGPERKGNVVAGIGRVGLIALCSALIAAHALSTLISTQVKGDRQALLQDKSREERWDWATQWSLPKKEVLGIAVPGLFGFRMDTPGGGEYWGEVGRSPGWEMGKPGSGWPRYSGSGQYAGVLVVIVALFGLVNSLFKEKSVYSLSQRRIIWFWSAAAFLSLLFAFGRHAPFYKLVYSLPYFSTIRNPVKFLHPFQLSLIIVFGFGLHGLWKLYLQGPANATKGLKESLAGWWHQSRGFERTWRNISLGLLITAIGGWFIFYSSKSELIRYLQENAFPPEQAALIASFSVKTLGWFLLFLLLSLGTLAAIAAGFFRGARVRWAWLLLGAILVFDLYRADKPWIVYYDYKEKYADNPVISQLRQKPHLNRVTAKIAPFSQSYLAEDSNFAALCNEWLQHHFQYYQIQSLDIVQMPRVPELDRLFITVFQGRTEQEFYRFARLWELSNTGLMLAERPYAAFLNEKVDPEKKRFKIVSSFNLKPVALSSQAGYRLDIEPNENGRFCVVEFAGALPRARLFYNWQSMTNDNQTLAELSARGFDPASKVFVAESIPAPTASDQTGTNDVVEITDYKAKSVKLRVNSSAPAVLVLNDRYEAHWKVRVGGQPAPLLRCNFIMRGVQLSAGQHEVEFYYDPPSQLLWVSLAALGIGVILCLVLLVAPSESHLRKHEL